MASKHCMQVATLGAFKDRVEYFLTRKALVDLDDTDKSMNHDYCKDVLKKRVNISAMCVACCTNATIAATIGGTEDAVAANDAIPDTDIEYVIINEMFDLFAK